MKTSLTSRRGARIVTASDGRETTLSIGVPRRGCGGVDPTSLQGAAWDTLVTMLREFEADGVKTNLLTARNVRRKAGSPDVLTIRASIDAGVLARDAAARFDGFVDDRLASLAMRPRNVVDVPLDEVVDEARRQEQFQLPRRSGLYEGRVQSAEGARRMAVGTTRIIGREGRENGGYVFAEVPVVWIRTSPAHVDADRQARQGDIRGTSDPAFATSWARHDLTDRGGVAGPALTLENGNNRVFFARQQGRTHYPVFVVRSVWEGLLRAVRDARRSAGEKSCAVREAAPNGRREAKGATRLVLWHATNRVFDRFDPDRSGLGTHFGTYRAAMGRQRQIARFRDGAAWKAQRYALRVTAPLRTDDIGGWDDEPEIEAMLIRHGVMAAADLRESRSLTGAAFWRWARGKLAAAGYDAVVYANKVEDVGSDSYVVWDNDVIDAVEQQPALKRSAAANGRRSVTPRRGRSSRG